MDLKHLLKRGALLAAANWPVVVVQFVAETTYQVLLAVPVIGAAILVAVLLGADLADLLQGGPREIFTTIASALISEPVALVAFITAFTLVLLGGSVLMFTVKGGTVDVLVAGNAAAGAIEREPIAIDRLQRASRFTLQRFTDGCSRLFRPYVVLGLILMAVYAVSVALYLGLIFYGYRAATGGFFLVGWTFAAAAAAVLLVAWITVVNLLYLLMQVALAVDAPTIGEAARAVARFIRAEFRELSAVFLVVLGLVIAAMFASALAWSGVGLIAFVPLVGLAVFPLQIAALLLRGVVFEYLGLTALGAYITLYTGHAARRSETAGDFTASRPPAAAPPRRSRVPTAG